LADGGDIEAVCRQRQKTGPLGPEEFHGFLTGLAMQAHIGHRLKPVSGSRAEGGKIGDLKSGEEVFFDIAHRVFHPALFVAAAHVAGGDGEAVGVGKIEVTGIEHRGPTEDAFQDRRLEVVEHDFFRHRPEEVKGVLMAGQEVLQALADG